MVKRNPHLAKLQSGYLFSEINKRKKALLEKNPHIKLISLGIGDTTEPIPETILQGLVSGATELGHSATYKGYGPEQGELPLRKKISEALYNDCFSPEEIFISDGSKCDIGRLQILFARDAKVAVQDPSYPAYVDTSVAVGRSDPFNPEKRQYAGIAYLPCLPENNFFPDLDFNADIILFCSPNNPTGAAATREDLERLVRFAKKNKAIIIYDAAYAAYIQDPSLPKTIYEIEGSREVAIELGSFSKMSGFTGVRLGWTIIPKELQFDDGTPVGHDWHRIASTFFNGASNIAQKGALSALSPKGLEEIKAQVKFYLDNASLIKKALQKLNLTIYGGDQAPYLWVQFPGKNSWEVFNEILEKAHLVTTPGSGFGPGGEQFIRFSAFGRREDILEACNRLAHLDKIGSLALK